MCSEWRLLSCQLPSRRMGRVRPVLGDLRLWFADAIALSWRSQLWWLMLGVADRDDRLHYQRRLLSERLPVVAVFGVVGLLGVVRHRHADANTHGERGDVRWAMPGIGN